MFRLLTSIQVATADASTHNSSVDRNQPFLAHLRYEHDIPRVSLARSPSPWLSRNFNVQPTFLVNPRIEKIHAAGQNCGEVLRGNWI